MLITGPQGLQLTNTAKLHRGDYFLSASASGSYLGRVVAVDDRSTLWVRLMADHPFTLCADRPDGGFRHPVAVMKLDLPDSRLRLHVEPSSFSLTPNPSVGDLVVADGKTLIIATWSEDGSDDRHGTAIRIDSESWEYDQIGGEQQNTFSEWQLDYRVSDDEWRPLTSHRSRPPAT